MSSGLLIFFFCKEFYTSTLLIHPSSAQSQRICDKSLLGIPRGGIKCFLILRVEHLQNEETFFLLVFTIFQNIISVIRITYVLVNAYCFELIINILPFTVKNLPVRKKSSHPCHYSKKIPVPLLSCISNPDQCQATCKSSCWLHVMCVVERMLAHQCYPFLSGKDLMKRLSY